MSLVFLRNKSIEYYREWCEQLNLQNARLFNYNEELTKKNRDLRNENEILKKKIMDLLKENRECEYLIKENLKPILEVTDECGVHMFKLKKGCKYAMERVEE